MTICSRGPEGRLSGAKEGVVTIFSSRPKGRSLFGGAKEGEVTILSSRPKGRSLFGAQEGERVIFKGIMVALIRWVCPNELPRLSWA